MIAVEKSDGFTIGRNELKRLLKPNVSLRTRILENTVGILCAGIEGANDQIENYAKRGRL